MKNLRKKITALITSAIMLLTFIPNYNYSYAENAPPPVENEIIEDLNNQDPMPNAKENDEINDNGEVDETQEPPTDNEDNSSTDEKLKEKEESNDDSLESNNENKDELKEDSQENKEDTKKDSQENKENEKVDLEEDQNKEENKDKVQNSSDNKEEKDKLEDKKEEENKDEPKDEKEEEKKKESKEEKGEENKDEPKDDKKLENLGSTTTEEKTNPNGTKEEVKPEVPLPLKSPNPLPQKLEEEPISNILDLDLQWALVDANKNVIKNPQGTKNPMLELTPKENNLFSVIVKVIFKTKINLPKDSISIKVPKYIFETRYEDGEKVYDGYGLHEGKYSTNIDSNGKISDQYEWQINSEGEKETKLRSEESNDNIHFIAKNFETINAATNTTFDIKYSTLPYLLNTSDNGVYERNIKFSIEYKGETIEKELTIKINTKVPNTKLEVKQGAIGGKINPVYFAWNPVWGQEPNKDESKEYYYIPWFLDVTRDKAVTSAYNISLQDITNNENESDNGEIVGVARYSDYKHNSNKNPNTTSPIVYGFTSPEELDNTTDGNLTEIANNNISTMMGEMPAVYKYYYRENNVDFLLGDFQSWGRNIKNFNATRYVILKRYELTNEKKNTIKSGESFKIKNKFQLTETFPWGETRIIDPEKKDGSEAVISKVVESDGQPYFLKFTKAQKILNFNMGIDMLLLDFPVCFYEERNTYKPLYETITYGRNNSGDEYSFSDQRYKHYYETETIEDTGYFYPTKKSDYQFNENDRISQSNINDDKIKMEPGDYYIKQITPKISEHEAVKDVFGNPAMNDLKSTNYERYQPLDVYVKILGTNDYKLYGSIITKLNGDLDFEIEEDFTQKNVWDGKSLLLPNKTIGIKYKHKSDFFESRIFIDKSLEIQPTEHVKDIMEKSKNKNLNVYFFHTGNMNLYNNGKKDSFNVDNSRFVPLATQLSTQEPGMSAFKKIMKGIDDKNSTQYRKVSISGIVNYNVWNTDIVNDMAKKYFPKSFILYDLLPEGSYIDKDELGNYKIKVGSMHSGQQDLKTVFTRDKYRIYFEDNWKNSGQTLMTIEVKNIDSNLLYSSGGTISVGAIYTLANSYTNISNTGENVENTLAFLSTDPNSNWHNSGGWNSLSNGRFKNKETYFKEISDKYNNKISFDIASMGYDPVTVSQSGGDMGISNSENPEDYKEHNFTYLNDGYKYRISLSASEDSYITNFAIYDIIEESPNSQWKGKLKAIDFSPIEELIQSLNINPKVYYSTNLKGDINEIKLDEYKLTKAENIDKYWKSLDASYMEDNELIIPKEISDDLTAIAIDLSTTKDDEPVIFPKDRKINIKLLMHSPNNRKKIEEKTENTAVITYKLSKNNALDLSSEEFFSKRTSTVILKDLSLKLEKTSNPVSGTKSDPVDLENNRNITYTIKISNEDNLKPVKNITILEKNIALNSYTPSQGENFYIFTSSWNIKAKSNKDRQVIMQPTMRTYNENGESKKGLFIIIGQLNPNETITITIPTNIKTDEHSKQSTIIENTASIEYIGVAEAKNLVKKEIYERDYKASTYHKIKKEIEPIEILSNWEEKYANIENPEIKVINIDENATKVELKDSNSSIITTAIKNKGVWIADNGFTVNYDKDKESLIFVNNNYKAETKITAIEYVNNKKIDSSNSHKNQNLVYDTIAPYTPKAIETNNNEVEVYLSENDKNKVKNLKTSETYKLIVQVQGHMKTLDISKDFDVNKPAKILFSEEIPKNAQVTAYFIDEHKNIGDKKTIVAKANKEKPSSNSSSGGGGSGGGSSGSHRSSHKDKIIRDSGNLTRYSSSKSHINHSTLLDNHHIIYIYGYPDENVRPDNFIKRSEVAAMIARIEDLPLVDDSKPKYKDTDSRWYNLTLNAITNANYMIGYPDGTFKPDNPITRGEFVLVISRIDKENNENKVDFLDPIPTWAKEAVEKEAGNKRIKGYPDGTFRANDFITRAEVATILNAFKNRKVNELGLLKEWKNIRQFKDLQNKKYWAYYEMIEATNEHQYTRENEDEMENWTNIFKTNTQDVLSTR